MKKSLTKKKALVSLALAAATIISIVPNQDANAEVAPINTITHTLTMNLNGGGGHYFGKQRVDDGELATLPNNGMIPFKRDKYFTGWYTDEAATQPMDFTKPIHSSMTLYAGWEDGYSIFFNENGGRYPYIVYPNGVKPGDTTSPLESYQRPSRTGYDFAGWALDRNGENPIDFSTWVPTESCTVYAMWETKNLELSFELNGGVGHFPSQAIEYGKNPTEPTSLPYRSGYTFDGWYVDEALTTPMDFDTWEMKNSGTVFAKWKRATGFTLFFDLAGGEGYFPTQVVGADGKITEPEDIPTKDGYVFLGWYINSTTPMNFDTFKLTRHGGVMAKWAEASTVSFELNGGTGDFQDTLVANGSSPKITEEPTRSGYVFSGWYSDSELTNPVDINEAIINEDTTFYAKWTVARTLSFNLNGGEGDFPAQIIALGSSPTAPTTEPTKDGHVFLGWFIDSRLTKPMVFENWKMSNNGSVFAKWAEASSVSFNLNGGLGDFPTQTVINGQSPKVTSEPTRSGYVFMGWYSDKELTSEVNINEVKIEGNTTFYAKWAVARTLSFELNGGEGNFPTQSIALGGNPTEPTEIPTREGYEFAGWYVNSRLTVRMNFATWVMRNNGTVFAKWTPAN